jgi:hypothetical protein
MFSAHFVTAAQYACIVPTLGSGAGAGSAFTGGGAQGGLFQQNRDVSGEFVVKGQDLVYVLGQANNRINKG